MFHVVRAVAAPCALLLAASTALLTTGTAHASAGLDLTCTATWNTRFDPGLHLLGSQSGTISITDGRLTACADTSGSPATIIAGTFAGSGGYTGSCTTGTATETIELSWHLSDGGTDTSTATASATGVTLAALAQLTVTGGRLAADTITVASLRTQQDTTACATSAGLTHISATGVMTFTHP